MTPGAQAKPVFRATSPEDLEPLRRFLSVSLGEPDSSPFLRREHIHWKYWHPRKDWEGARSFVVERQGQIAAHGAAWPVDLLTASGGAIRGFHLIDWAADPAVPGIGVALMRKMSAQADLVWVLGGTPAARRMREAMGFRELHPVQVLALPLRPGRLEWTRRHGRGWKAPARWLRNTGWARALGAAPSPWRATPAGNPSDWLARLGAPPGAFRSSLEAAGYFAACAVARYSWWEVWHGDTAAGFFCLTLVPGQARLADAWVAPDSPEAWCAMAQLAAAAARAAGAGELAAWAARPAVCDGFTRAGLRFRIAENLMVFDPKRLLAPDAAGPFHFQHGQGDQAFFHQGYPEYLC